MEKYIVALDQGTTSSRAIVFDQQARVVAQAQREFKQIYPTAGWVEHDPMEIWSSQRSAFTEALARVGISDDCIAGIGITNQRETTIVWNRKTGKPIYNAIVWQCRRSTEYCERLKRNGYETLIVNKTGLILDPYFSASKVRWILDNVKHAQAQAEAGELLFGTVDSWLVWKLTNGRVHITDPTNASRTMLYNIHSHSWDDELLSLFNIPKQMLPQVKGSSEEYGKTCDSHIPIAGMAGDQQAALFGQLCVHPGTAKNTYGTGCFLLMNTGQEAIQSKHGLLTTVAVDHQGQPCYALEGSVFMGGATIQWLKDEIGLIRHAGEAEYYASLVDDNNGVYLVPAFVGLGAPYWDPDARGAIIGLTRGANKNHIIRAALESIAYQSKELLAAMEQDGNLEVDSLKVDGGVVVNNFLMQFQADIGDVVVERPKISETTALGAAFLAGLAVGFWKDIEALKAALSIEKRFEPNMTDGVRQGLFSGWLEAVKKSRH